VNRLLRALGLVAWLGVLGVAFVGSSYLAFSRFVRAGEISLPTVVGLSLEEGESVLAASGVLLSWREDQDRFDPDVPPGGIAVQSPRGGTAIKRGSVVEVGLSRGRERVVVPDLAFEPLPAVAVRLRAAGLVLGRSLRVFSETGAEGQVVRQYPPAGSEVDPLTPVDLFIRMADESAGYVMPELIYRDYEAVRGFFGRQGFRVGSVKFEAYEGAAPGTVLRQFPLPGHRLAREDVISLVVAAGGRMAADPAATGSESLLEGDDPS
jgi:serine/threonine-protein kinase